MKITERYIKAKAQQAIKTLILAKTNYLKSSEMNQKAMMEAKKEGRKVSILALNGHANYKTEHDYITALNYQISNAYRSYINFIK